MMGNRSQPWPAAVCIQCSGPSGLDKLHDMVAEVLPPIIGHTRDECPCGYHPAIIELLKRIQAEERKTILATIQEVRTALIRHALIHDEAVIETVEEIKRRIREEENEQS